jgi:uncharacterized coiled-coil DUF342 family protein
MLMGLRRCVTDLSKRSCKHDEEATWIKKERDKLLQRDDEAHQGILDLLGEVEKERDLKLGVEEKLMALETRAPQDATTIEWLRKERDKLSWTMERLYSECNTAHHECDQACQEHDTM